MGLGLQPSSYLCNASRVRVLYGEEPPGNGTKEWNGMEWNVTSIYSWRSGRGPWCDLSRLRVTCPFSLAVEFY